MQPFRSIVTHPVGYVKYDQLQPKMEPVTLDLSLLDHVADNDKQVRSKIANCSLENLLLIGFSATLDTMGVGAQNSLGKRNHFCPKNFATITKPDA